MGNTTFWKEQSQTFDEAAEYYDKYRPSYPKELINDLINMADLKEGSKILEIGSGSGKATELFVPYGYKMTCIEPGENLVIAGEKNFSETGNVTFYNTRFEDWVDQPDHFDLVISAQAFHWVPKPLGYEKCARNLKKDRKMALFWNYYCSNNEQVDIELQELLNDYPIMYIASEENIKNRITGMINEIKNSGYFKEPQVLKYPWSQRYTKEEYIGFIRTGNGYLSLDKKERSIVEKRIREIIDKNGGYIERPYICVCYLADRL